ncbi:MAG: hypothetical protein IJJ33_19690, partial [Victivallales bacterium]|nr:hypothetical protein [Victivallales bacterium]
MTKLFPNGTLQFGCNYWASHAGIRMWSDWREDIVQQDFAKLAAMGCSIVRIFPLWSDFQPLETLYEYANIRHAISFKGGRFPNTPAGRAGVDETMVARFARVLDLAQKHGLKVVVGLITGWMSGSMYQPPAFAGLNPLTDPECINWEVRMIHHIVSAFRDHPAVGAWEPGNECNCLGMATREQNWLWLHTICTAIRQADGGRHEILSGMHGLQAGHPHLYQFQPNWMLIDQTDEVDCLTTHPYPAFTPHVGRDGLRSFRSAMHAVGEGTLYADIGQRPCIAEEVGTLSPFYAADETKRLYLRKVLFNLWAHDGRALLWWCAAEQSHLDYFPYERNVCERKLGLFQQDGAAKPFASVFAETLADIRKMHPAPLPPRRREALCVLSSQNDTWVNAWGTFLLSRRAGFDIQFAHCSEDFNLPEMPLYVLPGLQTDPISRTCALELLRRVQAGASLYLSLDDGCLSILDEAAGILSDGYIERPSHRCDFDFAGHRFSIPALHRIAIRLARPGDSSVLASED